MADRARTLTVRPAPSAAADGQIQRWMDEAMSRLAAIYRGRIDELTADAAAPDDPRLAVEDVGALAGHDRIADLCQAMMILGELKGRLAVVEGLAQRLKPEAFHRWAQTRLAAEKQLSSSSRRPSAINDQPAAVSHLADSRKLKADSILFSNAAAGPFGVDLVGEAIGRLPFAEAIKSMLDRVPILKPEFLELGDRARSAAFTMARVLDEKWLDEIKGEMDQTVARGETFFDFWKRIKGVSESTGWTGTTQSHARLVYGINVGQSYTAGRVEQGTRIGLRAWTITPSTSANPRPEHELLVGEVYKYLPGATPMPPLDFNCEHGWEWVDDYELEDRGINWDDLPEFELPETDTGFTPRIMSQRDMPLSQEGEGTIGNLRFERGPQMGKGTKEELVTLACFQAIGDGVPSRVLIVPWGEVQSSNGRWVCDLEAANAILQKFKERGVDVPFDRDHGTMSGDDGSPRVPAPATGWIKSLEAVINEGIYAVVEWTRLGRDYLASKEYRYPSPVVLVRKSDRKAMELHSVALTNKPAIVGMPAIVNRESHPQITQIAQIEEGAGSESAPSAKSADKQTAVYGCTQEIVPQGRSLVMTNLKTSARQIVESAGLSPELKLTKVLALIDQEPEEAVANKAALAPLAEVAESLGEDGRPLAEAIAKGDGAAAAAAVGLIVNRQTMLSEELKTSGARLAAVERDNAEQAWQSFRLANSAKIPPAERDKWHDKWLTDRKFVEEIIACRADLVRTESVQTAGGAAGANDRAVVINSARAEYRDHPELKQIAGERAMVNDALRQKGLVVLSDDEVGKLAIAV